MAININDIVPVFRADNSDDRMNLILQAQRGIVGTIGAIRVVDELNEVRGDLESARAYESAVNRLSRVADEKGRVKGTPHENLSPLQRIQRLADEIEAAPAKTADGGAQTAPSLLSLMTAAAPVAMPAATAPGKTAAFMRDLVAGFEIGRNNDGVLTMKARKSVLTDEAAIEEETAKLSELIAATDG